MKIAIVIPTLTLGGAEKIALDTANTLAQLNHEVHIIVMSDNVILAGPNNVRIHQSVSSFLTLVKTLKNINVNHCISYMERANLAAALACKILRINHCATVHTAPVAGFKMRSRKNRIAIAFTYRLLRFMNTKVIGVSKGIVDDLGKLYGIKNSYVVPNFVDIHEIEKLSKEYDQSENYDYIFVGRLAEVKGCHVLISALAEAKAKANIENFRVAIVGDGPERDALIQVIEQKGLKNIVHMIGAKVNPFPYMIKSSAIVVPSYAEGFGMVVLEGLSLGKKIIFSRCDFGPKEIIDTHFQEFSHLGFENPSVDFERAVSELGAILINEIENKTPYDGSLVRYKVDENYNKYVTCSLLLKVLEQ